jgi:hypothetical protein
LEEPWGDFNHFAVSIHGLAIFVAQRPVPNINAKERPRMHTMLDCLTSASGELVMSLSGPPSASSRDPAPRETPKVT